MAVRNRLQELIAEKAKRDGRKKISASEVAREVGMSRQNMAKWIHNNITTYDSATLAAFCRYFRCGVGDIIIRDEEPTSTEDSLNNGSSPEVEG